MKQFLRSFATLFLLFLVPCGIIVACVMMDRNAKAAPSPITAFTARKITVTTTATSVKKLVLAIPDTTVDSISGRCNVTVLCGATVTEIDLGGPDLDSTNKFVPICISGVSSLGVDGTWEQVFLKTTSGTLTAYVTIAGGC